MSLTAGDYLNSAYRIDLRINAKLEQLTRLRALVEKTTGVISDMPPGGFQNNGMADTLVEMLELETMVNSDMRQLINTKREITILIKCVDSLELQTILELRYLNFRSWSEIAASMHYAERNIFRLHKKALKEIEKIRRSGSKMH